MAAQNRIDVGYHVTNASIDYMQPSWNLRTSPASTSWIDNKLLGINCVFFSTTQYCSALPTFSVYPERGIQGTQYHRVLIPMSQFNDYEIRFVNDVGIQVLLLLARPGIDAAIANQFPVVPEPNNWLWRQATCDPAVKTWYTNDYSRQRYFVNVAVLDYVITAGCNWDTVKHRR